MQSRPLLCELHSHSTWSDGGLSVRELVDLHGRHGFDVLCVTDHVVATYDPARLTLGHALDEDTWDAYLETIFDERERARSLYDLLLIPGVELTDNCGEPEHTAHALALGLTEFVSMETGLVPALRAARRQGAVVIAAHPSSEAQSGEPDPDRQTRRPTRRFWHEFDQLRRLIDRFELFNGDELFGWIADAGVPVVATGDLHVERQLASWKTLLLCEKDEAAVLARLRAPDRVYLTPCRASAPATVRAA